MTPLEHFKFCPRCGTAQTFDSAPPFRCTGCGFVLYINTTVAATAIIARPDGTVLFIERAKEPAKGKLAFPGGFIDAGETAEAALRRETREEVGIEISDLHLICSHPNEYLYQGVTYPVLDFIFSAAAEANADAKPLDGVARIVWQQPDAIALDELAFPSLRAGLRRYLESAP